MRNHHTIAAMLLPAVLSAACVTSSTTTRTWGPEAAGWIRYGRVETIQETVMRQEGHPGAGAVAGAVMGGLLGGVLGGHTHYDHWGRGYYHPSAAGAVVGAVGGAMVGAAASQGGGEASRYDVLVRFEDGGAEWFSFEGGVPFRVGDPVSLTAQGLVRS